MQISRFARILKIGIRSLLLHKLRTFLSVLGIIFGVGAVVSMLSITEGAKQESVRQIQQLGASNVLVQRVELSEAEEKEARKRLSLGLSLHDAERIRIGAPQARLVVPIRNVEAPLLGVTTLGGRRFSPEIIATTPQWLDVRGLEMRQGRFICPADVAEDARVCVLGFEVSNRLGAQGRIGGKVRIGQALFRVVGVLQRTQWTKMKNPSVSLTNANKIVVLPLGTGRFVAETPTHLTPLNEIIVKCDRSEEVTTAGVIIESILDHHHHGVGDFNVVVPLELIRQAQETQRQFNVVLGCIAGISLLVGGIGIMNIMLATVSERTREVGIRRAVGAARSHIVTQFLIEAMLLTFCGGVLGLALGVAGARLITVYNGWETIVTAWSVALSMGTSVLVGTFFGLYPAYKAARLDPIEALRRE